MVDRVFPVPEFAQSLPLPRGWCEQTNDKGRKYYLDYNRKTTTFDDPRLCPLPVGWEMKWDTAKSKPYFSDYHTKTTTYKDPRETTGYVYNRNSASDYSPVPLYANDDIPAYARIPSQDSRPSAQTSNLLPQPQRNFEQSGRVQTQKPSVSIIVNSKQLTEQEIQILRHSGSPCLPGSYWYDHKCGAFGYQGGPCLFWWVPGLKIGGPLQANASNGNTGVFINGRQLCTADVIGWNTYVGPCLPGRYTLDAMGNCSYENGFYIANVYQCMMMKQRHYKGSTGLSSADIEFIFSN